MLTPGGPARLLAPPLVARHGHGAWEALGTRSLRTRAAGRSTWTAPGAGIASPGRRSIMGAPPDIVAFHVGIVVRDLHAVMDRYQRLFALEHWHLREPQPGLPMRIAYGGRAGAGPPLSLLEPVA